MSIPIALESPLRLFTLAVSRVLRKGATPAPTVELPPATHAMPAELEDLGIVSWKRYARERGL